MDETAPKRCRSASTSPSWWKRPASATTSLAFPFQWRHAGRSTPLHVRTAGGSAYCGTGAPPAQGGCGTSANAGRIFSKGAMAMALTAKAVLEEIKNIHKRKPMYGHPLWTGMVEGTFSLEQVRFFCLQHGIIPLHNHNYHGRLYVVCPDANWRERIAEVAYEEATGRIHANGVSHHKLYLNYGKALGLSREQMLNADYCGGGLALKSYFSDVCGRNFLEGVSAHMLAGEAPIPGL